MQDRFKFRYVFKKDFGGKTGICYKMPIFNLDTVTDENFNKIIKSYIDYGYKLISIEQSTGLKDKNGNLIYEGDIIQVEFKNETHIAVVEYDKKDTGFGCKFNPKSDILYSLSPMESRGLIIGNIYENSELLKKFNNINQEN